MQLDIFRKFMLPNGIGLHIDANFGYPIRESYDNQLKRNPVRYGSFSDFNSGLILGSLELPVCKHVVIGPRLGIVYPLTGAPSDYMEANSIDRRAISTLFGRLGMTVSF